MGVSRKRLRGMKSLAIWNPSLCRRVNCYLSPKRSQLIPKRQTWKTIWLRRRGKGAKRERGWGLRKFVFVFFVRGVTDAINALVTVCTAAAPGQRECDNALRKMQTTGAMLQPVNDSTYFACVDSVVENSKVSADSIPIHTSNFQIWSGGWLMSQRQSNQSQDTLHC